MIESVFSVGISFLPDDGGPPTLEVIQLPWPEMCPIPTAGDSFVWEGVDYGVLDVQYQPCNGHGDNVFMVHVTILLGDPGPGPDVMPDIVLP